MANIRYYLTSSSNLENIEVSTGNLIFCEDERTIYLDGANGRTAYRQIVTLPTEASRVALPVPLKTFYFVTETCVLWNYDGEWHQITTTPQEQITFGDYGDFPTVGDSNRLYIDGTKIYRYINGAYQLMSGGSIDWGRFN